MIRIGFLSAAHLHADAYATCLSQIEGVEIAGIWDDVAERAQAFARSHNTRFVPDAEALLGDGLDGVIICSENNRHRQLTELAAPRTRNILCEKPIATTLEDGQA